MLMSLVVLYFFHILPLCVHLNFVMSYTDVEVSLPQLNNMVNETQSGSGE